MQAIARMQHRAMTRPRPKRFVHPQSTANKRVYASRAYVKRAVKGLAETKFHNDEVSAQELSRDVEFIRILSDVPQGDASNQREGDRIDPQSLQLRYSLIPTDATTPTVVRIIVFQWMSDGTDDVPTQADILVLTAGINSVNSSYIGTGARNKFRILHDRRHTITTTNAAHIEYVIGFATSTAKKMARCHFVGADEKKGAIYIMGLSTFPAASAGPELYYHSQLRFKDI